MKTITKEYSVYTIDELSKEAQEKAINDYINDLLSIDWSSEEYIPDYIQRAIEKSEEMRTPWFCASYVYEYGLPYILSDLQEYHFTANGDIDNN